MKTLLAVGLAFTLSLPRGYADETSKNKVEERARIIATFLDDQTLAVAYADWSRVKAEDQANHFNRLLKIE
ncbi:MAG TPA: hypothetical protein VGY77_05690, partial [Gemmataceae bacterium]|nr:hypothetical protein [Gemmataceae bacterium]